MSDRYQKQLIPLQVELVNNPEITHPQTKSVRALHAVMWKSLQRAAKLV